MTTPLPTAIQADGPYAGVLTLTLEQPGKPVVVLNLELIQRLEATLKTISRDVRGVVVASASERVFVAGADLKSIQELDDPHLHKYLEYGSRVFGMLSQLPCPTAAAIGGAALGGGLELAMHCDGLIGAPNASGKPYPIGLPEAGLSICPGWGGTNLLPSRMEPKDAITRTATGKPMMYEEAVAAHLFDAVAPSAAELVDAARAWVCKVASHGRVDRDGAPSRWIGRVAGPSRFKAAEIGLALMEIADTLPETGSADAVARCVDTGLREGWQAALKAERDHLVKLRSTPEGKAAIAEFFAKSKK